MMIRAWLVLMCLVPAVAAGQGVARGSAVNGSGTSLVALSAPRFTSSAASGANGFACSTNGARVDFGAGASDYASSDGTTVSFAGPMQGTYITASAGIISPQFLRISTASALGTCGAGAEGIFRWVTATGGTSTGARTKICLCTSDGAASPAYSWKNISGVFASDAASVGDATTCP